MIEPEQQLPNRLSQASFQCCMYYFSLSMLLLALHLSLQHLAPEYSYSHFISSKFEISIASEFTPVLWIPLLRLGNFLGGSGPISAACLNALISTAIIFLGQLIFQCITQSNDWRKSILAGVIVLSVLIVPSFQLNEIPLALFLLLAGLRSYFSQGKFAFFFLTFASGIRPELSGFLLLCATENIFFRRVVLKSQWLGFLGGALGLCCLSLGYDNSVLPIKDIAVTVPSKQIIAHSIIISFGYIFDSLRNFVSLPGVVGYICAVIVLSIYFALKHLHAPNFVLRDRRNSLLYIGAFLTFSASVIFRSADVPGIAALSLVPLMLGISISAHIRVERLFRAICVLIAIPPLLVFGQNMAALFGAKHNYVNYQQGLTARSFVVAGLQLKDSCRTCRVLSTHPYSLRYTFLGQVNALPSDPERASRLIQDSKPDIIIGTVEELRDLQKNQFVQSAYNRQFLLENSELKLLIYTAHEMNFRL
jgi:hypothetical protein